MAYRPPEAHTVFQGIGCPECRCPQNHIQDTITGTGLNAYGRSDERTGTKTLLACEGGHPWILGIGEHKGDSFLYVRLPLGGEVEVIQEWYARNTDSLPGFRFSGRAEPRDWQPRYRPDPDGWAPWPLEHVGHLDTGIFR